MHPILFDLGSVEIAGTRVPIVIGGYGVMFALAIVAAWISLVVLGRRISRDVPWSDFLFVTVLSGVAGAKLANLVAFLPDVVAGRKPLVGVVTGGGVWLGGVAAGLGALWLMVRRYGLRLGLVANAFFVFVPLSHAIGRVGCLLGGCCWGRPTGLPWAVTYTDPAAHRLNGTPLGVALHPTVLYEAGLEAGNFLLGLALWHRGAPDGAIVALWMGLYGTERFLLEFLRGDPRGGLGPLSTSQWLSLGLVAIALGWALRNRRSVRAATRAAGLR